VMQSSSGPGLAQYGLSPAKATAELTTTDGKTITLLVGKEAPTNIGYYAMMKGDSKVYLVSTTLGADLTAAPQSLIDLNLVTLDQNKLGTLSQLTFAGTGRQQPIKLTVDPTSASSFVASTDQNGNIDTPSYNIISPGSYVTNYENISTMLNNMLTLNASDIASLDVSDKSLSSFGLKNPAYTLSYTYNKESYTLSFGNTFTKTTDNAQYVYVTITGKNLIYDIAVSSVPFYNWSLSDVGPSTVYESPLVDDVKSFTIASPSSSWTFNLSGSLSDLKVLYGSKTLNTDQFMNLYEQDFFMPPQGTGTMPGNTQVLLTETLNYKDTSKKPDVIKFYTVPDSKDPTKADSFKVFCTVNGVGNFYVKRSLVDSILQYTQDYVNGKDVPSE
jgi:hypothetical protein